ncbi:hypothetical protein O181_021051 [Austropuccinia psidii MF-1]|uniref:mRNA stability protein n=1 Tax=Austropuccinia psidii MF-1 TaxID=1389203 RepID=A0A9Q3CA84_9BASI|nr:hypothetical protein [Austropuccinia psidii MF-1]
MSLNPLQRQKVDVNAMTEEEQKLFRLYGKLPPKKNVAKHNLLERRYFDSGDYALSKAGKTAPQSVGTTIPSPENIHHATHPSVGIPLNTATFGTPVIPHTTSPHLNTEAPTPSQNEADDGALTSADNAAMPMAESQDALSVPASTEPVAT